MENVIGFDRGDVDYLSSGSRTVETEESVPFSGGKAAALFLYRYLESECGLRVEPGRQGLFELAELSGNERAGEFVFYPMRRPCTGTER